MILNSPYITGSLTVTGNANILGALTVTGSLAGTATSASYAYTASSAISSYTASSAVSSSYAFTASYASTFTVGSTLTAQTLVVQTITSSIDYITGSTRFGSLMSNTHTFTGSLNITGSVGIGTTPQFPLHIYSTNQNVASTLATAYSNAKLRLETYYTSGQGISMGNIGGYSQYIQAQYSDGVTMNPLLLQPFSGSVGIGTSSTPTTPLLVYSNIASTSNVLTEFYNGDYTSGTRNFIRVRNGVTVGSTQSSYFGQGQDGKTYIISNDFTKNHIVIDSANNNVGIGTSGPIYNLDVYTTGVTGSIRIRNGNTLSQSQILFESANTYSGTSQAYIRSIATNAGNADISLAFGVSNGTASTGSEAMRIIQNGYVGVNNISPAGFLEVGSAGFSNTPNYGGELIHVTRIAQGTWTTFASVTNNSWAGITELNWVGTGDYNRSGAAYLRWAYNGSSAGLEVVYTLYNNSQNATATFRNSSGNLQINIAGGVADYWLQVRVLGSRAA